MPSYIKIYDGSKDPEDHLKIFQSVAKTERWSMPSWCHMFNSTLIDMLEQKKCIKDSVEIHNIRQRDGESRIRAEPLIVNGRSHSRHGNSKKLTKSKILKKEASVTNKGQKESKIGLHYSQKLSKTPKEIFALDKEKFKAPPLMTTPIEKWNHAKFYDFHGEVGHNTNECMHLRKQIEEMLKAGKLSYLIKELKQNNKKEQPKVTKKRETFGKDKALAILMVQPWERVARQRITQSFSLNPEIFFPPLGEDEGTEGPMIIEAEIEGHCIHCMYMDGESASEILYEHCFSRLRPEIKNQLMPATTPLIGFSGELQATIEERVKVAINLEYPEQTVMIGSTLTEEGCNKLCNLLQRNLDIFAWKPADMTGVPRHIAEHRLNVWEGCSPVRQKKRGQSTDKNQAIREYPEQTVMIGSTLTEEGRNKLCGLLQRNSDIFA
ncbi:hypothetical protein Tco_0255821 [Tanacetum coccineum]